MWVWIRTWSRLLDTIRFFIEDKEDFFAGAMTVVFNISLRDAICGSARWYLSPVLRKFSVRIGAGIASYYLGTAQLGSRRRLLVLETAIARQATCLQFLLATTER